MVATPSDFRVAASRLDPPKPMMAGAGVVAPAGMLTDTLKLMLLPPRSTFTLMEVLLTLPVTLSGLPGFSLWIYFSTIFFRQARWHFQSDLFDILDPSAILKRSGSALSLTSLGSGTSQSSP